MYYGVCMCACLFVIFLLVTGPCQHIHGKDIWLHAERRSEASQALLLSVAPLVKHSVCVFVCVYMCVFICVLRLAVYMVLFKSVCVCFFLFKARESSIYQEAK